MSVWVDAVFVSVPQRLMCIVTVPVHLKLLVLFPDVAPDLSTAVPSLSVLLFRLTVCISLEMILTFMIKRLHINSTICFYYWGLNIRSGYETENPLIICLSRSFLLLRVDYIPAELFTDVLALMA